MEEYRNFDILIEPAESGFLARVLDSPGGSGEAVFTLPFTQDELENFVTTRGPTIRAAQQFGHITASEGPVLDAKAFGQRLYSTIFRDEVLVCLINSTAQANRIRIRLRFSHKATQLAQLPWEFLHNKQSFFALSERTPIVRYIGIAAPVQPLQVEPPLRVLVVVSSPPNVPKLQVEKEWGNLQTAWEGLNKQGLVSIERLDKPTLPCLLQTLRKERQYHVFHFIGHGGFDSKGSVLLFEDEENGFQKVGGDTLATYLNNTPVRLAILNACEGARSTFQDPFSGVAQSLVRQGIPAVIAMQFEITDQAAVGFSRAFYDALADRYPVDAALTNARKAISTFGDEWGTPVLYLRSNQSAIFAINIPAVTPPEPLLERTHPIEPLLFRIPAAVQRAVHSKSVKIGTLGVLAISVLILAYAISSHPSMGEKLLRDKIPTWTTKIVNTRTGQGSKIGFRPMLNDMSKPAQAFATAQALVAVLSNDEGKRYSAEVRSALDYIEKARRQQQPDPGWAYEDFSDDRALTEITGWTTLAKIYALRSDIVVDADHPTVFSEIQRDLADLAERQNPSDGGWSPIRVSPNSTRTYSTAMALWALLEASSTDEIKSQIGSKYDQTINNGINWLLQAQKKFPELQWVPDPHRQDQNINYLGLTAQVLFVLSRAEQNYSWIQREDAYREAKTKFLNRPDIMTMPPSLHAVLDNADQWIYYPGGTFRLEGMTYYWYPWSLAAYRTLSKDTTISLAERHQAIKRLRVLYDKQPDASIDAEICCTFQLAEYQFGIGYSLRGK